MIMRSVFCMLQNVKSFSKIPTTVLTKIIGVQSDDNVTSIKNIRNEVHFNIDYDHPHVLLGIWKRHIQWTSQFFFKIDFVSFIKDNAIKIDFGKMKHNCVVADQVVKIHGDLVINHHDWVVIVH